ESMFSRRTDASKVALVWLVALMKSGGFTLLDCQFMTDHLRSLGAVEISQADYLGLLGDAVAGVPFGSGRGILEIGGGAAGGGDGAGAGAVTLPPVASAPSSSADLPRAPAFVSPGLTVSGPV